MFPSFACRTRIYADVVAQDVLVRELERLGAKRVMLVSDAGVRKAGLVDPVLAALPAGCAVVAQSDDIMQDPTADLMDELGRRCVEAKADVVLAIGGGACLDAAKAAAIVARSGGSILDSVGEDRVTVDPLPVIAIPTTAGTGSEASWHISVNDDRRQLKVTVRSPRAMAETAILDAAMVATVPPLVAAAAGMDALTHVLESYVGNVGRWDLTDAMGLHACGMIGRAMIPYWRNPKDRHHASQMLIASCIGGIALSHSRTGIVHQMARPLGALFHVPHGLANAALLPWCLEFTHASAPKRFAAVAGELGLDRTGMSDGEAAAQLAPMIRKMNDEIGIPASLRTFGVTPDAVERMAGDALQGKPSITNPCFASKEDVMRIYLNAIEASDNVKQAYRAAS